MNTTRMDRGKHNAKQPQFQAAMAKMRRDVEEALSISYIITANECGDWGHYYHCHHDGTRLQFDWKLPKQHRCLVCGTVWTGEPFDAAWQSHVHVQIGHGIYSLGIMYGIDPQVRYAEKAKSFLLAYADHYGGYKPHGDIPYNGPGKLFSQTLDESHWILDLVVGYGLLRVEMDAEEDERIREGLLRPCANFLITHKEQQIHNHASLITSAICSLGVILQDEDLLRSGLDGEYGLMDQIIRGVLGDGLWYEGNFNYHFYAFESILTYCFLAEGTQWDLRNHPTLVKMFDFPLAFILPDGSFPMMNDASSQGSIKSYARFYEIALDWQDKPEYRALLKTAYGMTEAASAQIPNFEPGLRDSVYAILYGQDLTESSSFFDFVSMLRQSSSAPDSGLTKLVRNDGLHAIVKHSKFGGEHDHMDRLGISLAYGSIPLMIDPGTVAYGVPAHYAWFKHTYSHNTVCIDGKDQPPQDARVIRFEKTAWGVWVETAVDWKEDSYTMKDKIILPSEMCPWDEEAYRGAEIRRINVLTEQYLLDIVRVTVPSERELELSGHFSGEMLHNDSHNWQPTDEHLSILSQDLFKDKQYMVMQSSQSFRYKTRKGELEHWCWCSRQVDLYTARTPDNPPHQQRQSVIQKVRTEGTALFVQALMYKQETDGSQVALIEEAGALEVIVDQSIQHTDLEQTETNLHIKLEFNGKTDTYLLRWIQSGAILDKVGEEIP